MSTGGTIEKTYDSRTGELSNDVGVLDHLLARLDLSETSIERVSLMNKDSRSMTIADLDLIADTAIESAGRPEVTGVVVVHGTDRLAESAEVAVQRGRPVAPIVFTGAMRPYELRERDALQNLTEALMAAKILPGGVYLVMHGQVLEFPGVVKDDTGQRFVRMDG